MVSSTIKRVYSIYARLGIGVGNVSYKYHGT